MINTYIVLVYLKYLSVFLFRHQESDAWGCLQMHFRSSVVLPEVAEFCCSPFAVTLQST